MPGKSKVAKKKRAKMRKRTMEDQNQLKNRAKKKVVVPTETAGGIPYSEGEVLGNNAEPSPPKVNEDTQNDEQMLATAPGGIESPTVGNEKEPKEPKDITDQTVEASKTDHTKPEPEKPYTATEEWKEPKPFDPASVVANILKKK